jgi:hypothetical protein
MVSQLQLFHRAFNATDFKFIKELPPAQHFPQLNVFPVKELVTYGIREAEQAPLSHVSGLSLKVSRATLICSACAA